MTQPPTESRYAIVPAAAIDDAELTLADHRVLGVIGYHSGRKRPAWPRQRTIADRLGLARETVNRSIRRLWRKGYIDIAHQFDDAGAQRESYYFVRLDPDQEVQPVEVLVRGKTLRLEKRVTQPSHPEKSQGGDPSAVTPGEAQPGHTGHDAATSHKEEHPKGTTHKNNTPSPKGNDSEDGQSKTKAPIAAPVKAEFDQLWKLWPATGRERSKSRSLCLQAFAKAATKAPAAHIVEAASAFVGKQRDPQFTPALERWLRDGRYEHFLPAATIASPEPPRGCVAQKTHDGVDWAAMVQRYVRSGFWTKSLGPRPDEIDYCGPLAPLEAIMANGKFGGLNVHNVKINIDRLRADSAA